MIGLKNSSGNGNLTSGDKSISLSDTTNFSNDFVGSIFFVKSFGKVHTITMWLKITKALTAGTLYNIASTDIAPNELATGIGYCNSEKAIIVRIWSDGNISIIPTANISAGGQFQASITFIK